MATMQTNINTLTATSMSNPGHPNTPLRIYVTNNLIFHQIQTWGDEFHKYVTNKTLSNTCNGIVIYKTWLNIYDIYTTQRNVCHIYVTHPLILLPFSFYVFTTFSFSIINPINSQFINPKKT